ncbi:MAG: isoprenylcysteine carboxylmethyltransferase family protein [Algoriphagus sp.]|uniref:methyltransferase family protein n=1 Tax=Algoriphagus sp. TaxID=1872435 RepID=UPI0018054C0E|nr:isoprenylcysteine carboxylmethyltransferase family protein [Algoriphagus sp.]NVJ86646.1 isoprenylcysteine carboxylmethyltransferase family protein [Algoriphagus sp.]
MNYLYLILLWGIFYALHSTLATGKLKRILKEKLGKAYKWYRLFYSLFSLGLFLILLFFTFKIPPRQLFVPQGLVEYFGYMFATFGTIIMVQSSKAWSMGKFFGWVPEQGSEREQLIVSGWYKRIRHPLYAGLLLIFIGYFLVSGTYTALVHLGCLILYLPIGIYFEEKNLIAQFGEDYKNYQKAVPAIFPKLKKATPSN